jgi:hypothetical protein
MPRNAFASSWSSRSRAALLLAGAAAATAAGTALADDPPLGAVEPDGQEQAGIYALNRARNDPAAYGTEIGTDLSAVAAQQPLAVNENLTGSARFHATEMLVHAYFNHVSPVTGKGPNQMAVDNGYDLFGQGLGTAWTDVNTIESIAFGQNRIPTAPEAVALLVIDAGVPGLGHRTHLMATVPQFQAHREIGCGHATGGSTRLYSIHTAYRDQNQAWLTGVVFDDLNHNLRYDAGEGMGGVTVDAGGGMTAVTMAQGGFAIPVPASTRTVNCSGGNFAGVARAAVTVGTANVEVDFQSGLELGEVAFGFRNGGIPLPPVVTASASPATGSAPLSVNLGFSSPSAGDTPFWRLGDGDEASGATPTHDFTSAGLFPNIVEQFTAKGFGRAMALVAVDGAAGGGPGTTPPSSRAFTLAKGTLKANFKTWGKDQVALTGTVELPAGFLPGGIPVQACVGAVKATFVLDAKGKGKDATGNSIILGYKRPKGGAGTPAGAIAKITLKVKGNLRYYLEPAGLRDFTESGTREEVPFGLLLDELAYTGAAPGAFAATRNVKGTMTLAKPQ